VGEPAPTVALQCACGREREDVRYRLCEACRDTARRSQKAIRERRRADGGCTRCGYPAEVGQLCRRDWFEMMGRNALGSRSHGAALARLWLAQGGRCAYTGRRLVPGVNASVDHVVPRARGGRDELANLVWCCAEVNRAKTDMTPQDFRALCAEVLAYHAAQNVCANDVFGNKPERLPADAPINIGGVE
jgi:5-methylcytosine-specific restriction endonuclease McrA